MIPSSATFLNIIRDTLAQRVSPHNTGEPRKVLDSGVQLALRELLDRATSGPARQRYIYAGLIQLTDRHNVLVQDWPACAASPVIARQLGDTEVDYAQITTRIDELRGGLIAEAPQIAASMARDCPPQWRDAARDYLVALTRNELDEISHHPASPGVAEVQADRVARHISGLTAALAKGLGRPDLQIVDYSQVSGGFSRDTFLVTTLSSGRESCYVIRAASEGVGYLDAIYRSIAQEYPLLQLARRCGIPVPEVFMLEVDAGVFGNPFILMERCRGAAVGDTMHAKDRVDLSVFQQLARLLAALHKLPWQDNLDAFPQMAGRARITVAESTQMFIDKNRRWRDSANLRPSTALTLADDWLSRNIPPNDDQASFIHGDIGFHNMLIDGDEICAVLDWEGGAVGNPAWDLVAARLMLDERVSWAEFGRWYVEAGGKLPRDDEMDYWLMMRTYSGNISCTIALEKMFEASGRIDYLELGIFARPFYLGHFADSAADLWRRRP